MFPIPVSKTKIIPPKRRADLLARKRLLDMLFDMLDRKLALVSAPAGYGKTSLLIDAALQCEFKCCWLSLDELDRQPQRFLAYLLASIAERFPGVGAQTAALMNGAASLEDEMERLAVTLVNETVEGIKEHFVLILDDFHILDGVQPIYDFLNRFIQLADDNCHIVISSRALTTLSDLPLMVAREQVGGLSFSDLAFRGEEIQDLIFKNSGVYISEADAQRLYDETEGWITGLQFSGGGFTGNDINKPIPNTGVGLFDYLGQQVLDRQKPELREFLLRTSVMGEFDAALCEAVLAPFHETRQDWDSLIRTVIQNNLFAVYVGADGRFLRYHHLFRDYLRARMRRERGEELRPILARLAQAYEAQGEWEKAHYVVRQLDEADALARLIELASFNNLQNIGGIVEGWMRELPPSILRKRPGILSAGGAIKLRNGDHRGGIADLDLAIEAFRRGEDLPQLVMALTRRAWGHRVLGDYPAAINDAEAAIRSTDGKDDLQALHADALRIKGWILFRIGQPREALTCFEQAHETLVRLKDKTGARELLGAIATAHQALGNVLEAERIFKNLLEIHKQDANLFEQANLLNQIGFTYHQEGQYEKTANAYEEGLLCARRSQNTRAEALISIGLGDLYAELGDFELARQNFKQAETLLLARDDTFLQFALHLSRANLALLQNNLSGAEDMLKVIEEIAQASNSQYERGHARLARGRVCLMRGDSDAAVKEIEEAQAHFDRAGLILEGSAARVWLSAAYAACGNDEMTRNTVERIAGNRGRVDHTALAAAIQALPWLEGFEKDSETWRLLRPLLSSAKKLASRFPALRRELRWQSRALDVPAAQLSIQGFGRATVKVAGREVGIAEWQTWSVRDFFFFLLSSPKALSKEQIAQALWPELDDPARIRMRFKNEMYRLRRAVGGDIIRFENGAYSFDRDMNYEYDVELFESCLAREKSAQAPEEQAEYLRKAVDLANGLYLEDIYMDWAESDRTQWKQACLDAFGALSVLYFEQGRIEESLAICQRAVKFEPVDEAAYRQTMKIHHRRRDRSAFQRAYQVCVETLEERFGLPPSQETEDLYRSLQKDLIP